MYNDLITSNYSLTIIHFTLISKFPNGGVSVSAEVCLHFHPERQNKIQDYGRSEREERGVNEIKPDAAGRDIHLLPQPGADPKCLLFNEISNSFHTGISSSSVVYVYGGQFDCWQS